ncbi:P450-derived glycosyltransferase activator [Micromonospora sp. WMMD987]|uniref:cytochrome P450 family protein n=1 Tax=Micromonospora sp. WMMD987 TaxID=3016089 RepID=UPI002499F2BA|nr:P450-derived glycosyltransferase activator [Micromonospora sp. WMMD987]WFE95424.1 P450-derived glycosyltransferase activator [Micromonospora sp. WMMD987]
MSVDGGLRRRMQLVRGIQWLRAAQGDPFADLLRGQEQDPAGLATRLRAGGPVTCSAAGTWVVARHPVAAAVLADPAYEPGLLDWRPAGVPAMPLTADDLALAFGERDGLRALTDPVAGPAALARRHDELRQACERELTGRTGDVDLADITARMCLAMLAELVDLSPAQRDRLAGCQADAGLVLDAMLCPQGAEATGRMLAAVATVREIVAGRQPYLVLALLGVRVAADLLGNALAALVADPRRWAALAADPTSAPALVDETLRHSPPIRVQLLVTRADTEIEGRRISAGSQVAVLLHTANRDPAVFTAPDDFDPDRRAGPATLLPSWPGELVLPAARAQAAAGLTALVRRFAAPTPTGPALRRLHAPVTAGVLQLPVRVPAGTTEKSRA